ncbi:MAG: carboxypeptidase regulatory-like domain-containing protein, partial [Hyphomicrobiales bacterium]|nr:carboxypeptidase regulatory-like domain-containing protein [Hyphomicrobiales bacterium]
IKPRRSPYIGINCEAHNFMFGFIMAPSHPYAVVVGDDGSFSIDNLPPGDYTLKAWHPRFGVNETEITVAAEGTVEADFSFSSTE